MKQISFFLLNLSVFLIISGLLFLACNESEDSGDDEDERDTCNQARDCGEGGVAAWKCIEGLCYSLDEFCYDDSECVEECVDHVCKGGRLDQNGDGDAADGDREPVAPCLYQCCDDSDCPVETVCDLVNHICVLAENCTKECCSIQDCLDNPSFGEGYICRMNKCVDEDAPCEEECCDSEDCDPGYICDLGNCIEDRITCNPGDKLCCDNKPNYAGCAELGTLSSEAKITCNANGDGYIIEMCPDFQDCLYDGMGGTECFPNGRCEISDDCDCPETCQDIEGRLTCVSPSLNAGDICFADICEAGDPIQSGRCPENYTCCLDDKINPTTGTCTLETACE